MIYAAPKLEEIDHAVIQLIGEQKTRLRFLTVNEPRRWFGSLRRNTLARAIRGSNSIEGYNASMEEALAAVQNEPPIDKRTETWLAITGYRSALTYIIQAAHDPYFEFTNQFLKSLHFMMIGHDLNSNPGQWRQGDMYVVDEEIGEMVYEAPDSEVVNDLIGELVVYLDQEGQEDAMVRGAMAHLNLTMIHPFKDGNGRMARALQTFVLAREGVLQPVFSSIEEWLGRNTQDYYNILSETGKGAWHPENDTLPWVRFCLKAHYQQAATLVKRIDEYGKLYTMVAELGNRHQLHERMILPMFDMAMGMRMSNSKYQAQAEVSKYVATNDLRKLSELRLIEPEGEKRGRSYSAGEHLRESRALVKINKLAGDPYEIIQSRPPDPALEPSFPGL